MLSITRLSKTYRNGTHALRGIDLEVGPGLFGLLGPNGAGKTTLMRTIAALQRPDEGRILLDGVDVVAFPQVVREQLGYLPQEFGVYPGVSAEDSLNHLAILKGLTARKSRHEQVRSLLHQVGLDTVRHKAVSTYSGGMRQRFGIAQALLGDPKLLIVDEPTAGLDPQERYRFLNLISGLGRDRVVLLSTHIVEDIRELCTQMAILCDGSLLIEGAPEGLLSKLSGRVWTKVVHADDVQAIRSQFRVLSTRLRAGRMQVHVLHDDCPGHGFSRIEPNLEDLYFHVVRQDQAC